MRTFFTLWRKELSSYFLSPIAYVVMMFFLVVMGVSFSLLVSVMASGPSGVAVMKELFSSIFFWLAMLIVVPVLTMRLFAEEKRSGTIETLMSFGWILLFALYFLGQILIPAGLYRASEPEVAASEIFA